MTGQKPRTGGRSERKKHFLMVIDHNYRDAGFSAMLLQNFGYTITMARTGQEALEMISLAAPALIISELVLPDMSGLDLYGRLAQDTSISTIPFLIQTRFPDVLSEDRCRRAGCTGCLNKPVQVAELYRAVQAALEPTPRQNIRITTALNASVDETSSYSEKVTSLSDTGLFVRTLEIHPIGSEHIVTFLLSNRVIRADVIVLYAYPFGEAIYEEPGMGMKFKNLSPVDKDFIQNYINEQMSPAITPEGGR